MYEIGDKFPFVASISNKYTSEHHSRDDSSLDYSEGPPELHKPVRMKHSESMERLRSSSLISSKEGRSMILQNTKEHLVQMWLNINEKVSPSRKQLKEQSKERYVPPISSESVKKWMCQMKHRIFLWILLITHNTFQETKRVHSSGISKPVAKPVLRTEL